MKIRPMTSTTLLCATALVMSGLLASTWAWSQQHDAGGGSYGAQPSARGGGSVQQLQQQVEDLRRRVEALEGRAARSDPTILGDGRSYGDDTAPPGGGRDAAGRRVMRVDRIEPLPPDANTYSEIDRLEKEVDSLQKTVDQTKRQNSSMAGQGSYSGSYRGGRYGRDNTQTRRRRESGKLLADYQAQLRKKEGELLRMKRELEKPRQTVHGHWGAKIIVLETTRDCSGILDRMDLGDTLTWNGRRIREDASSQNWVVNSVERVSADDFVEPED